MKKIPISILALFFALLMSECIISQLIGYPRYVPGSRKFKIHNKLKEYNILTWRSPFYKYWSVEGGNNIVECNNIGLHGSDINIQPNSRYILLLGDSFIEAGQYDGEMISAGIMQKVVSKQYPNYNIINLGSSAHDPYILWYRTSFFENWFKPDKVILVYESFERLAYYYSRWNDQAKLLYEDFTNYDELAQGKLKSKLDIFRSKSSYINLMTALRTKDDQDKVNDEKQVIKESLSPDSTHTQLLRALDAYKSKYGDAFYFVSLMRDNPYQNELKDYCRNKRINYSYNENIMIPSNLINGRGHLNIRGNHELGIFLGQLMLKQINR